MSRFSSLSHIAPRTASFMMRIDTDSPSRSGQVADLAGFERDKLGSYLAPSLAGKDAEFMAAYTSHIDAEQRETLRDMLIRLRAQTYEQIQRFRRDQEGESETAPGDEMDAARSTADVETHAGLIGRAEEKLKFLDDALTLLDEDKFGICGKCGEAIPMERLIAIPFALYCVNCQGKQAAIERRASEGGTVPPYDQLWSPPEEMAEPGERNAPLSIPEEDLSVRQGASGQTRSRMRKTPQGAAASERSEKKAR